MYNSLILDKQFKKKKNNNTGFLKRISISWSLISIIIIIIEIINEYTFSVVPRCGDDN